MARILLAEDDEIMRITLYDRLKAGGWEVDQAENGKDAFVKIKGKHYHLVISDIRMPGLDGVSLLQKVKQFSPQTDVILMTAYGGVDDAVSCLKKGATDYILKPFDMDDLTIRVKRLLEVQAVRVKCAVYEEDAAKNKMIGNSPAANEVYQLISTVAPSEATVLITGESGTGKEMVAAAIHSQSRRSSGPYIRINCAAIPENLIESELFGHEKGAFTGADQRKTGKFALADGGTILLDEIGDMHLSLQVKLLRVIQEREVEPVGGQHPIAVDVRIICSTAMDLAAEVEKGTFRKDLYYRLKVIPIDIPPLRERKEDIPLLCNHFLEKFCSMRLHPLELATNALDILLSYNYPGNIRELKNIIERVSVLTAGPRINKKDLPSDLTLKTCEDDSGSLNLAETVARAERLCISKSLQVTGGNKTEAAKLLGISRKNLWEKMK